MYQKRSFLIHTLNSTLAITRHSRAYPSGVRTARWGFSRAPCLIWIWQNPLAATGAGEPQRAHRQRPGWSCCTTQPDAARLLEQMFSAPDITAETSKNGAEPDEVFALTTKKTKTGSPDLTSARKTFRSAIMTEKAALARLSVHHHRQGRVLQDVPRHAAENLLPQTGQTHDRILFSNGPGFWPS